LEKVYGENYAMVKQGVLGETALALALTELTFDVYAATLEDDGIGKVDMWADPRDGNFFAFQIKTRADISSLSVTYIRTDPTGNVVGIEEAYKRDMQNMVDYLRKFQPPSDNGKVVPILVLIPAGNQNEAAIREYLGNFN
jgi:hypothetical protein